MRFVKKWPLILIVILGLSVAGYTLYFLQVIEPERQLHKERQLTKQFRDMTRIYDSPDRIDGPRALGMDGEKGGWSNEEHVFLDHIAELESLEVEKELKVINSHVIAGLRADALMLHLAANGELSSAKLANLSFEAEEAYRKAHFKARNFMDDRNLSRKQGFGVWFSNQHDYRWRSKHCCARE